MVGMMLHTIVAAIKDGAVFHDGDEVRGLFLCPVRFRAATESGRAVLRAIFPDPQGLFPGDPGCMPEYDEQLEMEEIV